MSVFGPSGRAGARLRDVGGEALLCDALATALIADIEGLTDEELRAEFEEDGEDMAAVADRLRRGMLATIDDHRARRDARAFVGGLS